MPTQAQRTASARFRLIAAASELVTAYGSAATSVMDIGERAGLSRGSVNFHFGTKAVLLEAVLTQAALSIAQVARPPADLAVFFKDSHGVWFRDPARARTVQMLFAEGLIGQTDELRAPMAEVCHRWREGIAATLTDLQARGVVREGLDPDAEAALVVAAFLGLVAQGFADPGFDRDAAFRAFRSTASERLEIPVSPERAAGAGDAVAA